ncbi:cytochrome c3 family protein [Shewanella sp. 5_MG-2023]|uniref:cytochrome c3 family protein n=1 Tax=Shewanella sp. 5_MG-2023 TaxID=3062656 RepID=UPI0026E3D764|nr:cytochrome c3 family protein [Shewanella sp. 5_MG-2023]MDO6639060.1 cytochrome c3 family protein [Shewanella sp. 5_MG-2023]
MKKLTLHKIVLSLAFSLFTTGAIAADSQLLEATHKDAGLVCKDCHISGMKEEVRMTTCIECHDTAELAKTTADHPITNPHENRHFGTETNCNYCHKQHEESVNYCGSCHLRFDLVTP